MTLDLVSALHEAGLEGGLGLADVWHHDPVPQVHPVLDQVGGPDVWAQTLVKMVFCSRHRH